MKLLCQEEEGEQDRMTGVKLYLMALLAGVNTKHEASTV